MSSSCLPDAHPKPTTPNTRMFKQTAPHPSWPPCPPPAQAVTQPQNHGASHCPFLGLPLLHHVSGATPAPSQGTSRALSAPGISAFRRTF